MTAPLALPILARLRAEASSQRQTVALGDATDPRMLQAARQAMLENLATPILCGSTEEIEMAAKKAAVELHGIEIADAATDPRTEGLARSYHERHPGKVDSVDSARTEIVSNPLLFAALLARSGAVDGVLAGSLSTTGNVIRAALRGIGTADNVETISSMFLMCFPKLEPFRQEERNLGFADCAVVPDPSAEQLADIATSSARTFTALTQETARVAMLSFSTKGSAGSESTERVARSVEIARSKSPDIVLDGELQFDAALIPEIGRRKAPGSPVAGQANVFVFPDLNAGNIGYKIAERLGMAQAIGPVMQGLACPMNDLSRGASVSDIVNMIAITALQAAKRS